MNNPIKGHMEVVNKILKYLKMTSVRGPLFTRSDDRSIKVSYTRIGQEM